MDYFYYVRDTLRTDGAPGRTRTDTGRILSPLSLPLDYGGQLGKRQSSAQAIPSKISKNLGYLLELLLNTHTLIGTAEDAVIEPLKGVASAEIVRSPRREGLHVQFEI